MNVTTSTTAAAPRPSQDNVDDREIVVRDPAMRIGYARAALARIPRLLGAIDRNSYHASYGCLDRQFWHYRTAAFPSEMYQEGALALALAYATPLAENRWHGAARVRELAIAALRFSARSGHADGSCDDYYPFERALGAAVFSLQAAARAYDVLELDDSELRRSLARRAEWIADHGESGRLANHEALAALALARAARVLDRRDFREAADERIARLFTWQPDEGWFDEYGGADPGYQTVTIDCLAKYRQLTGATWFDEPLRRAVDFARLFLHADDSYAGEYGSRGTYHFYPHGLELLAADNAGAADLADAFLRTLAAGREASFDDDRLVAHRLANLFEAYRDWSPTRPSAAMEAAANKTTWLPRCGLLVRQRAARAQTVVSAARGGVFKHFREQLSPITDCGLVVELTDGRVAVSQQHDPARDVCYDEGESLTVGGTLTSQRHETATPVTQAVFHVCTSLVGRWCRGLVRRVLQRRLVTGRRACPVRLTRRFEFLDRAGPTSVSLRVIDTIELVDRRVEVRRMSFGSDHQTAYVAASNIYHDAVLCPWFDLADHVARLNAARRVEIVREF